MTVKELASVLLYADKITLLVGAETYDYNKNDPFIVESFGAYKVHALNGNGDMGNSCTEYEIEIELQPVKG